MPNKTIVAIVAVAAIIITCIIKNIDGAIVGIGCTLIAGLGGYIAGRVKK
ncbi:hypothetical protein ES708_18066 [subsurface metagenome]